MCNELLNILRYSSAHILLRGHVKKVFANLSLRIKIIITLLACGLLPTFFVSRYFFENCRAGLTLDQIQKFELMSKLKIEAVHKHFDSIKNDAYMVQDFFNIRSRMPILINFAANHAAVAKAMADLDSQLATFIRVRKFFDLMLVSLDGKIVYSSNKRHRPIDIGKSLPDPENSAFLRGLQGYYLSKIFLDEVEHDLPAMLATIPAYDLKGTKIGVIAFELNMNEVYNLIQDRTGLGKTGEIVVAELAPNGERFRMLGPLRHDDTPLLQKYISLKSNFAVPMQIALKHNSGTGESIDYRGQRVLASWQFDSELNWGFVVKMDSDEVFAPIANFQRYFYLASIIIFLIMLVSGHIAASYIARPLSDLTNIAKEIGSGNFSVSLPREHGADEIGQLSQNLMTMSSQLKLQMSELKNKNLQIEQSSKLKAIGEMSGNLVHEIKNPITTINLAAMVIRKLLNKEPFQKIAIVKQTDLICATTTRVNRIIEGLKTLSHSTGPDLQRESLSIKAILNDIIEIFTAMTKHLNVVLKIDWNNPLLETPLELDRVQISQIFLNLLNNSLAAFKPEQQLWIAVDVSSNDTHVCIHFTDSGNGISQDIASRIFEPYFSTKPVGHGTGLGLSLCRKIVEAHGGNIYIDMQCLNTSFVVELPHRLSLAL